MPHSDTRPSAATSAESKQVLQLSAGGNFTGPERSGSPYCIAARGNVPFNLPLYRQPANHVPVLLACNTRDEPDDIMAAVGGAI